MSNSSTNSLVAKSYSNFSRLRFIPFIYDPNIKTSRLGLRDTTFNGKLDNLSYKFWTITSKYQYRPDLISVKFFGTPELWWVLSEFNKFKRPLQDFETNVVLKVPNREQVMGLLL